MSTTTPAGTRRLALILDTLDPTERAWHKCPQCGAGWATPFECRPCDLRSVPAPTPFVSASGSVMGALLANHGIRPAECFVGTLDEPGMAERLAAYEPHLVLLLGTGALRAFHGTKAALDDWRGSVFEARGVLPGVKCLATFSPERLRKDYSLTGVVRFDLERALGEVQRDGIEVPQDQIAVHLTFDDLIYNLGQLRELHIPIAVDIEGYVDYVSCVGFATRGDVAFVVPLMRIDNTSWWTEDEECRLWAAMAGVLSDPDVPKVLQNSLYDCFVLAWSYGIVVRGVRDDTMLKHFELYPELEKSLAFQTSIYTRHPFYKSERNSTDETERLTYCGKDCCRTYEINEVLERKLGAGQHEHYRFNMALLAPCLYMELRGMRYDKARAKERLKEVEREVWELQDVVNREAASCRTKLAVLYNVSPTNLLPLVPLAVEAFCKARRMRSVEVEETRWQPRRWNGQKFVKAGKLRDTEVLLPGEQDAGIMVEPIARIVTRNEPVEVVDWDGVLDYCKDSCLEAAKRVEKLLKSPVTPVARAEIASLLGLGVNVNSTSAGGDAQWYLYEHLGLPKQFQKEGSANTTKLASDDEAVLKAFVKSKDERVKPFLKLRRALTLSKFFLAQTDPDGRIRFGLNLVGTPTGRMAAYGSPTGTCDLNPQTITKALRDLYPADEGCDLYQSDLDGSDTYTVAAYCAALGDRTMLDDNLNRVKPAKVLVRIYESGPSVNLLTRDQLKQECKSVDGEGWLYFACKRVTHGSNYLMGKITMANQILTDSYKLTGEPIWLEPAICERIQKQAFFVRYPGVLRWHQWIARELKATGQLVACNGFRRQFFGRKSDNSTQREALAHMPQVMTTYANNRTLLNLWSDPDNRRPDGALRVEPLLVVHDSIIKQAPTPERDFVRSKMPVWTANELSVMGVKFTIPMNSTGGPNWLHQGGEKWAKAGGFDL